MVSVYSFFTLASAPRRMGFFRTNTFGYSPLEGLNQGRSVVGGLCLGLVFFVDILSREFVSGGKDR